VGLALAAPALSAADSSLPPFIHNSDLLVNPKRPSILYASFWIYGVYKSQDYGKTWRPVNAGLKSTSVYALAMSARDPDVLFAGTHAGGMYRSSDGGSSWTEINTGLTTGTIWDLAVLPGEPETVYALTSLGLFSSRDGGDRWTLEPGGVPGRTPDQQMTLLAVTNPRPVLYLQNGGQLFRWDGRWSEPMLSGVTPIRAMPVVVEPTSGALVVGTLKGLVRSGDGGATWNTVSGDIPLPNWLVYHPANPRMLFVGTDGRGLYRSGDGGRTFQRLEKGLTGPTSQKIFGLAIDPTDGRRVYAASHSIGLFRSEDGGETWSRPERFPVPDLTELARAARALVVASPSPRAEPIPSPPAEFLANCNRCHGWTDPALDTRSDVVWRAAPIPRDWTETVRRMGRLAALNEPQVESITRYMNTHFGSTAAGAP
jgi:photosystem II stability/assembly factor-like uncharacterized protein